MSSTVTHAVQALFDSGSYRSLARTLDVIVTLLLFLLLVEAEVLRAYEGARNRVRLHVLGVAVLPLLLAFVLIVTVRVLDLR